MKLTKRERILATALIRIANMTAADGSIADEAKFIAQRAIAETGIKLSSPESGGAEANHG